MPFGTEDLAVKDAQKEFNYKLRVARRNEKFEIDCSTMDSKKL